MQRGFVLALDVAQKMGVAEGRPGEVPRLTTVDFGTTDLHRFYGSLTQWMASRLIDGAPDLIAIEAPIAPSAAFGYTSHDTTMTTIGGFGILIGIIVCKSIPFEVVPISTWRKHFLGKGNFPSKIAKAMAIDRCKLLGWDPPDHNAAEAGGIWDYAGATFMRAVPRRLHLFKQ